MPKASFVVCVALNISLAAVSPYSRMNVLVIFKFLLQGFFIVCPSECHNFNPLFGKWKFYYYYILTVIFSANQVKIFQMVLSSVYIFMGTEFCLSDAHYLLYICSLLGINGLRHAKADVLWVVQEGSDQISQYKKR